MTIRGSAKRLKRAIRALDRRRRKDARPPVKVAIYVNGEFWGWLDDTIMAPPTEPLRAEDFVGDFVGYVGEPVTITFNHVIPWTGWETVIQDGSEPCAESVDAVESTEPYSCIEGK